MAAKTAAWGVTDIALTYTPVATQASECVQFCRAARQKALQQLAGTGVAVEQQHRVLGAITQAQGRGAAACQRVLGISTLRSHESARALRSTTFADMHKPCDARRSSSRKTK